MNRLKWWWELNGPLVVYLIFASALIFFIVYCGYVLGCEFEKMQNKIDQCCGEVQK